MTTDLFAHTGEEAMESNEKIQSLMRKAYKRVSEIYLNEFDDGTVELIWKRTTDSHMSPVMVCRAKTPREALQRLIVLEDEYAKLRDHREECACEDCCIDRVDRSKRH